jgi:hypothetical protein
LKLQQGFASGEMGFNDKFALQKILNGPCPLRRVWLFSNAAKNPERSLSAAPGLAVL